MTGVADPPVHEDTPPKPRVALLPLTPMMLAAGDGLLPNISPVWLRERSMANSTGAAIGRGLRGEASAKTAGANRRRARASQ